MKLPEGDSEKLKAKAAGLLGEGVLYRTEARRMLNELGYNEGRALKLFRELRIKPVSAKTLGIDPMQYRIASTAAFYRYSDLWTAAQEAERRNPELQLEKRGLRSAQDLVDAGLHKVYKGE